MFRKITQLSAQMSISLGKPFIGPYAEKLAQMNFSSNYWVSEATLKRIGVAVKSAEKNKGVELKSGMLYNASQTADPRRVESLYGAFAPVFSLSQNRIKDPNNTLTPSSGRSEWITKEELATLRLKVKAGSKPIEFKSGKEMHTLYCIDQVEGKDRLKKAVQLNHRSASSGIPYTYKFIPALVKATMDKGYTSGLWVTSERIKKLNISLKKNETPVTVNEIDLYNAQQTSNPNIVVEFGDKCQHISASSGKSFPNPVADQFRVAQKEMTGKTYPVWIGAKRAIGDKIVLLAEKPVQIANEGKKIAYFNVSQLKNAGRIIAQTLKKRTALRSSQANRK